MRAWLSLLVSITLVVALVLVVHTLKERGGDELGPLIPETEVPEQVDLWFGEREDLEVLVRPFYPSPERDAFNRKAFNEALGHEEDAYAYYRIWFINHGERPRRLPDVGSLVSPDRHGWRAVSLGDLVEAAGAGTPRYFRAISRVLAAGERTKVEPGELLAVVVASPPAPSLGALNGLEFEGDPPFVLRPAHARLVDLQSYEKRPRGRFGARVIYDDVEERSAEKAPRERASRGK